MTLPTRFSQSLFGVLVCFAALAGAGSASAAPYVPEHGAEVLERLPRGTSAGDPELRELRRLRAVLDRMLGGSAALAPAAKSD